MSANKPVIVAGIPALNEEATIAKVIVGLAKLVDRVIVCDDGSSDATGQISEALGAEVMRHERCLGYGAAISTLFAKAREEEADIFVTIDADGQHDPRCLPVLLEPIEDGKADVVIGSRFLGHGDGVPGYRKMGIKIINEATSAISGEKIRDTQSGLRAYSTRALNLLSPTEMGMGASVEILMKARAKGLVITEVPISILYEKKAARNPLYHGLDVALTLVKHMSVRHPLLFYGVPGFAMFVLGLVFGFATLSMYAASRTVATNVALVAIAGVTIGLLLMTTSIILWVMVTVVRGMEE